MKLIETPKENIKYGFLQNKAEWEEWTKKMVQLAIKENSADEVAKELFSSLTELGYSIGYDTAEYDTAEEDFC